MEQAKKIKTLFISGWYPSRVKPTLGNFVQKHAEAVSLYADVTVLHVCFDDCKNKFEIVEEKNGNINSIIIYINKPRTILQKFCRYFKAYKLGLKLVTEKFAKPDIIHANVLFPVGIVFLFLSSFKKFPFVFSEHSTAYLHEDNRRIGFLKRYFSKKVTAKASCIMPVSEHLKNAMTGLGLIGNYKVVPNVVDTGLFTPLTKDISVKNILHISSFDDYQKNISGIIRVVKKLSDKRNDFVMNFVTDGKQESFIEYAEKLNIPAANILFNGEKNTTEVASMMRESDFLLLFSNYENLPCVIVEAFAVGIPVVSTDVGGIPEIVSDKSGILVKPKDEEALFAAIDKMLDSCRTYDKIYLHQYAEDNFSYESVGKKFIDIYSSILNK